MTLESHRNTWSESFDQYYCEHIEDKLKNSFKGKVLELNVHFPSITTNNSESMNAVMKHFQNYSEVPVDKLVYDMYRLQLSYSFS